MFSSLIDIQTLKLKIKISIIDGNKMNEINRYSEGKIYKIFNRQEPEKFYVEFNNCSLSERFTDHKWSSKNRTSFLPRSQ